jgi:hypothetical protein
MNTKALTAATFALFLSALQCTFATPLQRADVPAEPAWVLHFDCDALRPSAVGQFLLAEMEKPEAQAKLAAFQAMFNFDLRNQLHGLTLYSLGTTPQDGVLLVYADFDAERLLTMVKAAKDYQGVAYKQHVIHQWIDEKKKAVNGVKPRTYAAICGGRIVIFGQRQERVAQALDVTDRSVPTLLGSSSFPQLGAAGTTSFIEAAARKLDLPSSDPNAAMFKMTRQIGLQVSESQAQVSTLLTLEANDSEVAGHMATIAQGLVSLMKLQTEKPEAVKLADALTVKQEGPRVVGRMVLPVGDLIEMIRAGAARKSAEKTRTP